MHIQRAWGTGAGFLLFLAGSIALSAVAAEPFYQSELIFPLQEQHTHSSTIVQCPNGDLLACWFQGSGERRSMDVALFGARLRSGDSVWSEPFPMADTPNLPDCNPVLFVDRNEELWLFWIAVLAERWEDSLLRYRKSRDYQGDGPPKWHWQDVMIFDPGERFVHAAESGMAEVSARYPEPELRMKWFLKRDMPRILKEAKDLSVRQRGWMTRCRPEVLPSGRILLPLYSDGFLFGLMAISDDDGASWRPSAPIVGAALNQPSLARKKDGTLVAYMREENDILHRILCSESRDDGETWSIAAPTELPNPNASVEALTLHDGRWLLAYNDSEKTRDTLALALSDDEGDTWKWVRHLEHEKGGSFHYPYMIQSPDGRIHIVYTYQPAGNAGKTIKHVALEPEWVCAGDAR